MSTQTIHRAASLVFGLMVIGALVALLRGAREESLAPLVPATDAEEIALEDRQGELVSVAASATAIAPGLDSGPEPSRRIGLDASAEEPSAETAGDAAIDVSISADSLSGEVIGYSGYRVPGFGVQASPEPRVDRLMTVSAETDEAGRFEFTGLGPCEYRVHHVFHTHKKRGELPLVRPPARSLALLLEKPTLVIRPVGPGGQDVTPEKLSVYWGGDEEWDPFSSTGPPSATLQRLRGGRTLAILDQPGPWKVLAYLPSEDGELRAMERLVMAEEHREIILPLAGVETRSVTIRLVNENGVPLGDWTAKAWNSGIGHPVDESPAGSHRLVLPLGSWSVRLKPTTNGYLNAFDAEIRVAPGDPEARVETVVAKSVWGRLGSRFDDLSASYLITAVHELGGRYGFTHATGADHDPWSSRLLPPGSYAVTFQRSAASPRNEPSSVSQLEVSAVVQPGETTMLELSSDRFR